METAYGYIRVSTREQNEGRQWIALRKVVTVDENIYMDKLSGKDFERPAYQKMVSKMKKDDVLYVKSIDRLGRNYGEILEQWRFLTKEKGVDIVVLDMPLLDTRRGKDLMGTFLSDIVLQILSFVAENERSNIRQRQAEGISAAKARGVQFGRPSRPLPATFESAYRQWKEDKITGVEAAQLCKMPLSSFRYRAETYETRREKNEQKKRAKRRAKKTKQKNEICFIICCNLGPPAGSGSYIQTDVKRVFLGSVHIIVLLQQKIKCMIKASGYLCRRAGSGFGGPAVYQADSSAQQARTRSRCRDNRKDSGGGGKYSALQANEYFST